MVFLWAIYSKVKVPTFAPGPLRRIPKIWQMKSMAPWRGLAGGPKGNGQCPSEMAVQMGKTWEKPWETR